MKKTLFIIILFFVTILVSGCEAIEKRRELEYKAVEACIKQGGVPLLIDNLGNSAILKECKFPPK